MTNWYKKSQQSTLLSELESLKPLFAQQAQEVYDGWAQEDDGEGNFVDPSLGAGGICDEIAREIENVIYEHINGVRCLEGGQDGDDHSYVVVTDGKELYDVDIPPSAYETGGGYSWKKIPDVIFSPKDVIISKLPKEWLADMSFEDEV